MPKHLTARRQADAPGPCACRLDLLCCLIACLPLYTIAGSLLSRSVRVSPLPTVEGARQDAFQRTCQKMRGQPGYGKGIYADTCVCLLSAQ
jgi:hypothetical protein